MGLGMSDDPWNGFFKGGPGTALYHGLNVGFCDIKVELLYKLLYFWGAE